MDELSTEAIDGPIRLNVCLNGGKDCERKSWCPAHSVWARAQRAMLDVLMGVTVSAMAANTLRRSNSTLPIATLAE